MCLAIPTRLVAIDGDTAVGEVDGVERSVSIMMTPDVKVGDYVIVHAGFAIQKLDKTEAEENLKLLSAMARSVERRRQAARNRPRSS
uniref:HypC/HybG/HupF family hydrogenase formation chaperone n=1 Tax=candidate division WOR-3 bacterium TaxID=2052148 RepID=A0A7C4CET6_UNCW3